MSDPDFSVLDDLDLPQVAEGDDVPLLIRCSRGERWTDFGTFFDPFGRPLGGDVVDQARAFEAARRLPENRFKTSMWWNDVPLEVSTVYLGVNHQWWDGPPLVWETMIFTNLNWGGTWQWRYTTRTAAHSGHQKVVECLLLLGLVLADESGQLVE